MVNKRIIYAIATILLVLSIAGCNYQKPGITTTNPAEATIPVGTEPVETTIPQTTGEDSQTEQTDPSFAPSSGNVTNPETEPKETEPGMTDPAATEPVATQAPVAVHSHNYTSTVVQPTCTEGGYTRHTCACGDSYTDSATSATGHSWSGWTVTQEATETTTGLEERTCNTCGATESRSTAKLEPNVTAEAVEQALVKYINQFRAEQGSTQLTYLPGMSQVAQYRSKQLVTNFAHDTTDFREATAFYQYGEYINWADYGCPELVDKNYYEPHTNEAIGWGTFVGSADSIGFELASMFRNSEGHWRYVSSSEYSYIGVGCTYSNCKWYVCVLVGATNYG